MAYPRIKISDQSEEWQKGYKCGYQRAKKEDTKNKSRLRNLAEIPPMITFLQIEGDDSSFICSNCETSFEWYAPFKFCPECGGKSQFADMKEADNDKYD